MSYTKEKKAFIFTVVVLFALILIENQCRLSVQGRLEEEIGEISINQDIDRNYFSKSNTDAFYARVAVDQINKEIMPSCWKGQSTKVKAGDSFKLNIIGDKVFIEKVK